jgi:hypothetical protein
MASNSRSFRKKHFLSFTNITPFIVIITGVGVVVINFLNLGIINLTTPETIIIAFLVLLAFDAFIEHSKEFEEIKSGIEELKKELKKEKGYKDYEFIPDINAVWDKAIEMLDIVGQGGYIYDSSSVKNRHSYEIAIEKKCEEGINVIRLIASSDHKKRVEDFIIPPQKYKKKKSKDCISVHHLPYSLPFDVLITHHEEKVHAIIGFKTSNIADTQYKSALYISDNKFALQIESIFENLLLQDAKKHTVEINQTCNICKDIMKP